MPEASPTLQQPAPDAGPTEAGGASAPEYRYWAFISYSHSDGAWARRLVRRLEAYPIPRALVGRETPVGALPRRFSPCFRDRDELSGRGHLSDIIRASLAASRYLVVVCSPKSAASPWVNQEIALFKSMGGEERTLYLIVDNGSGADGGALRCIPPAALQRFGPGGAATGESIEPICADARRGKDGPGNAFLKLLAGMCGVGFDALKKRDRRRQRRVAIRWSSVALAGLALLGAIYYTAADAGARVPGGEAMRDWQDRYNLSRLRPVYSDAKVQRVAGALRAELHAAIRSRRLGDGWLPHTPPDAAPVREAWSHAEALAGDLRNPGGSRFTPAERVQSLDALFAPGVPIERGSLRFGWINSMGTTTEIFPALWTTAALAEALAAPGAIPDADRARIIAHHVYATQVLRLYHPLVNGVDDGGWNALPQQIDPARHHTYATALALLALLETHDAGLAWDGSVERRDALLRHTADWLANHYDPGAADGTQAGWHGIGEDSVGVYDGLTLQIYSELLRAERAGVGFVVPAAMRPMIFRRLVACGLRDINFPMDAGNFHADFLDHDGHVRVGEEAIRYLWWPWAIECCRAWLDSPAERSAPNEQRVQVRRTLGRLVVDLGPPLVEKAKPEWLYVAAEDLYGLGPAQGGASASPKD